MYSFEDYRADIRDGYRLPPPQRGAAFAAASKRLKQAIVIRWLWRMAEAEAVDLTPTLACHIAELWLGRGLDRKLLLSGFATPGRTASDKSPDHDRREKLAMSYWPSVETELTRALDKMKTIREVERAARFEPDQG